MADFHGILKQGDNNLTFPTSLFRDYMKQLVEVRGMNSRDLQRVELMENVLKQQGAGATDWADFIVGLTMTVALGLPHPAEEMRKSVRSLFERAVFPADLLRFFIVTLVCMEDTATWLQVRSWWEDPASYLKRFYEPEAALRRYVALLTPDPNSPPDKTTLPEQDQEDKDKRHIPAFEFLIEQLRTRDRGVIRDWWLLADLESIHVPHAKFQRPLWRKVLEWTAGQAYPGPWQPRWKWTLVVWAISLAAICSGISAAVWAFTVNPHS